MSAHDYQITNQTFPSFRSDLNSCLSAIQTTNYGLSTQLPNTVTAMMWVDSSNQRLNIRNQANTDWTPIGTNINTANLGLAALTSPAFTGTPTAPTAPANTNSTQIATTGNVIANLAMAANGPGWVRIRNSVLIQWGSVSGTLAASPANPEFLISYPVTFSANPWSILFTSGDWQGTPGSPTTPTNTWNVHFIVRQDTVAANQCFAVARFTHVNYGGGGTALPNGVVARCNWLAIGPS